MPISVELTQHTADPLAVLYVAYKQAVSLDIDRVRARIAADQITPDEIRAFIEQQAAVGHTSPYHMVEFTFRINGVSRSLTHQLVRHHVGVSFEQSSQRYVVFKHGQFPYVTPASVQAAGLRNRYDTLMNEIGSFYADAIGQGVPGEDARFVLPNATHAPITMHANLQALLHMSDLRLCTQAQWEIRDLFKQIRHAVIAAEPTLGRMLAPKCMPWRNAVCDESERAWAGCPLGGKPAQADMAYIRPHKSMIAAGRTTSNAVEDVLA